MFARPASACCPCHRGSNCPTQDGGQGWQSLRVVCSPRVPIILPITPLTRGGHSSGDPASPLVRCQIACVIPACLGPLALLVTVFRARCCPVASAVYFAKRSGRSARCLYRRTRPLPPKVSLGERPRLGTEDRRGPADYLAALTGARGYCLSVQSRSSRASARDHGRWARRQTVSRSRRPS